MAFYLVIDGRKNVYGDADSFVIRASGKRQAVTLAPLLDPKGAEVTKLEDGRGVGNGIILAAPADFGDEAEAPVEAEAVSQPAPASPGYAVL